MFSCDRSRCNGPSVSDFVNYFYRKYSEELREEYSASSEVSASSVNTETLPCGPYEKQDGIQSEGSTGNQENLQPDDMYKYHLSDFLESYVDTTQDTSKSFLWLNHIQKFSPVLSEEHCLLWQKTQPICNGLVSWYNKESEFQKDLINHHTSHLGTETVFGRGILMWLYSQKIQPKVIQSPDRILQI